MGRPRHSPGGAGARWALLRGSSAKNARFWHYFPEVVPASSGEWTGSGGWMITLQAAVTGALIGGLYAVMAAGLSVTWGVLRVINLAHFGLILLGAYLTYQLA